MLAATLIYGSVIAMAVLIHFEVLNLLTQWIPRLFVHRRISILAGVFGALIAHAMEVWLFALAYYFMLQYPEFGGLQGSVTTDFMDSVYFSFTCYTSLGFGDIQPYGHLRFLTGLEALTGLVMIGWTASFMLFIEMEKLWDPSSPT
jgi:hypothetical protein